MGAISTLQSGESAIPVVGGAVSFATGIVGSLFGGGHAPHPAVDVAKYNGTAPESNPARIAVLASLFQAQPSLRRQVEAVWSGVHFSAAGPPSGSVQDAGFADWLMATNWAGMGSKIQAIVGPYLTNAPTAAPGAPSASSGLGGGTSSLVIGVVAAGGVLWLLMRG